VLLSRSGTSIEDANGDSAMRYCTRRSPVDLQPHPSATKKRLTRVEGTTDGAGHGAYTDTDGNGRRHRWRTLSSAGDSSLYFKGTAIGIVHISRLCGNHGGVIL